MGLVIMTEQQQKEAAYQHGRASFTNGTACTMQECINNPDLADEYDRGHRDAYLASRKFGSPFPKRTAAEVAALRAA